MYVVHTLALWNILDVYYESLPLFTCIKHSFWMTFITGQCESSMYVRVLQMNPASD